YVLDGHGGIDRLELPFHQSGERARIRRGANNEIFGKGAALPEGKIDLWLCLMTQGFRPGVGDDADDLDYSIGVADKTHLSANRVGLGKIASRQRFIDNG